MSGDQPSPKLLRQLLRYEPETGSLFWRERPASMFRSGPTADAWNAQYAGKEAFFTDNGHGYLQGMIFNTKHLTHRVIWAIVTGAWPAQQIDHINGDRVDNRMVNLRAVTHAENQRNQRRPANNTSGVMGVSWRKREQKWLAHIRISGRRCHLGYFTEFDVAVAARRTAELEHGFHENHGRAP